jgi:5-methylcytosine-specific restriction enzyme subunit McrC
MALLMSGKSEDGRVGRLVVHERGESVLPLTYQQAAELQAANVCRVLPTGESGRWRVVDVKRVGVVAIAGAHVEFKPKAPLQSIIAMASQGELQIDIRPDAIDQDAESDVPSALVAALLEQMRTAIRQGLLRGYRETRESSAVVRGRWDIPAQLAKRPGIPLPLEIEFDDYTVDIPENRILFTALLRSRALMGIPRRLEKEIDELLRPFVDVGRLPRGLPLPSVWPTRLNAHYAGALRLATVILEAVAWTQRDGDRRAGTFLIDMAHVFERYVGYRLRRELEAHGFGLDMQDHQWRLDAEGQIRLRPDIVVTEGGRPITVADTKYKVLDSAAASPSNGDVYQAVAYALSLGVPEAHLVYVSPPRHPQSFSITSAGVRVHVHGFDLDGPSVDLRRRARELALAITGQPATGLRDERASQPAA